MSSQCLTPEYFVLNVPTMSYTTVFCTKCLHNVLHLNILYKIFPQYRVLECPIQKSFTPDYVIQHDLTVLYTSVFVRYSKPFRDYFFIIFQCFISSAISVWPLDGQQVTVLRSRAILEIFQALGATS